MKKDLLSTSAIARLLGVGTTTIKRWADEGRLEVVKTAGGHRRYRREQADRLLRQNTVKASLDAHAPRIAWSERWAELLIEQVESRRIQAALLEERARLGSWQQVADFLGEVIEQLGKLWQREAISVAEEHVASNGLIRAIAACTDAIPSSPGAPRALLCSVEGELHTLGLHLVELTLREARWDTYWLGGFTPTAVLESALDRYEPRLVAVSASEWSASAEQLAAHHARVAALCEARGIALVVGGNGAWPETPEYGARLRSFSALLASIPDA
jgi:excisionase family DNA binding protein